MTVFELVGGSLVFAHAQFLRVARRECAVVSAECKEFALVPAPVRPTGMPVPDCRLYLKRN